MHRAVPAPGPGARHGGLRPVQRYRECTPRLTFSGTTATASLVVKAQAGASIEADLTLYRLNGSRQIEVASWSESGATSLAFSDTVSCSRGYDYLLEVDVTVVGDSGSDYITKSVTASCV